MSRHKRVWAEMCAGTNVCGHNRVWAQRRGLKRVWAQSCGHSRVGTNVVEQEDIRNAYFYSHGEAFSRGVKITPEARGECNNFTLKFSLQWYSIVTFTRGVIFNPKFSLQLYSIVSFTRGVIFIPPLLGPRARPAGRVDVCASWFVLESTLFQVYFYI